MNFENEVSSVTSEFDDWGRRALEAGDLDALLDFRQRHSETVRPNRLSPANSRPRKHK
jgi:hypothetical protein